MILQCNVKCTYILVASMQYLTNESNYCGIFNNQMNIPVIKETTGEELQSLLNSCPSVKSDFNMIITSLRRRQLAGEYHHQLSHRIYQYTYGP